MLPKRRLPEFWLAPKPDPLIVTWVPGYPFADDILVIVGRAGGGGKVDCVTVRVVPELVLPNDAVTLVLPTLAIAARPGLV